MTICNLVCLNVGIIPIIYALDHIDINNRILLSCRLQFYIRHAFFQMMRTYKVLACMDRYALISDNFRMRSFSNRKVAVYLVIISALIWLVVALFFSLQRTIEHDFCNIYDPVYSRIYTIYYLVFAGIAPPMLIMIFSGLVLKNIQQMRGRVQPSQGRSETGQPSTMMRRRDWHLMRMNLVEVGFYIISTMPFSVYLVYKMAIISVKKTNERKEIEPFVNYLTQSFIMYLNTGVPFYIYIATSSSFRIALKRSVFKFYQFILTKRQWIKQKYIGTIRAMNQ